MATPPKFPAKSPARKPVVKKAASSAKPAASAPSATKASVPPAKPAVVAKAPFVIEPEGLSAFVDKSDSALPVTAAREAPKASAASAAPKAAAPAVAETAPAAKPVVAAPAAKPVVEAPAPQAPVVETKSSRPPQPAVVENKVAAKEPAAQWQAPNALEGHYIMNEAIETGKKFAEDAKTRLQSLVTDFNEKAKVAVEKSSKTAEELSDITKGNVEAFVESSKIAAKGLETLGQSAAEYGRQSYEKTSATLKSFASVKSPTEFFQLHSELVTSAFDTLASQTARNSEAFLKLAGEIAQPISNRYAVVSDKLKTLAA